MLANIQMQKTGAGGWVLCRDLYPLLIWSVRRVVRVARQTELSRWPPAASRRPANIDKNVVPRENRSV
jgi:hypothetical protein